MHRKPYPRRIKYTQGQRYKSFVILSGEPTKFTRTGRSYTQWKCLCDCGKVFVTSTKQIQKGRKSCGCMSRDGRFKKLSSGVVIMRLKYSHYRNSAKIKGRVFEVKETDFFKLIQKPCAYCGSSPRLLVKHCGHSFYVNGLDRIDSNKGYTLANVVPCCFICNHAKGTLNVSSFLAYLKQAGEFNKRVLCA